MERGRAAHERLRHVTRVHTSSLTRMQEGAFHEGQDIKDPKSFPMLPYHWDVTIAAIL